MKKHVFSASIIVFLISHFVVSASYGQMCPTGESTQSVGNGLTYPWGGSTPSTVTATITTTLNSQGEQTVVAQTQPTAPSFNITMDSCSLVEQDLQKWLKNGGFTGNGTNVNNFVARVQLTFSNPVPANQVFIALLDLDARGVDSVEPDGFIRFNFGTVTSNATPANFRMVTMTRGTGVINPVTSYNADGNGGIIFGISSTDNDANKYLGLLSYDTQSVSAINIFVRNIRDDIGIYVGSVSTPAPLSIHLISFNGKSTHDGNMLYWVTGNEGNVSKFVIERSSNAQNGTFTEIGSVSSTNLGKYQYVDVNSMEGKSFYRIKLLGNDGTFTYSPVVAVENNNRPDNVSIIPNPVSKGNSFRIKNISNVEDIKLYDLSGRMIDNVTFEPTANGANVSVSTVSLSKGLYVVAYKAAGNIAGRLKLSVQ